MVVEPKGAPVGTVDIQASEAIGCPVRKPEPQAKGEREAGRGAARDPGQSSPSGEGVVMEPKGAPVGAVDIQSGEAIGLPRQVQGPLQGKA